MANSYIFCQAPTKIPATLLCYEAELNKGNDVVIVTKNARNMYDFFRLLKLKAKIMHLEPLSISGSLLLHRRQVIKRVKDDIQMLGINAKNGDKIFFTDICDDFIMGLYLAQLSQFPICKIQGQIDMKKKLDERFVRNNLPCRIWLKEKIFSCVFNYSFIYTHIDHWTLTINIRKYNYPILDYSDMSVCSRYLVAPSNTNGHNVLFFTEPYRNEFQTKDDYMRLNFVIIDYLKSKGYTVCVKGHPRIGLPDGVLEKADFEVPSYLISEFIDLKSYDFAIGFVSTSVCNATAQIPAYSVLPMCEIINQEQADYWYDYINKMGNHKVVFINDFNELPKI